MNEDEIKTDESTEEEIRIATYQGWTPKESYTGDPDRWKTAAEFLEYGRKHNAVLKENNEKLVHQVSELQQTMQELVKDQQSQKQKAVEKAIAELKLQKADAISESDGDKVTQIDDEIDRLKAQTKPERNIAYENWVKNNRWYEDDPDLAMEANMLANNYLIANPSAPTNKIYEAVERRIKREFPDRFENPNKKEPASVVQGTQSPKSNGKGYNDLPPDAKAACDRFCKTIPNFTKEKYLSTYEWD